MIGAALERRENARLLLVAGLAATAVGVLAAAVSPLVPAAALGGAAILGAIWWRPAFGVWLFVAVVATLPFGVIPLPVGGAQLTFVDAVLLATFSAVLTRLVIGKLRLPMDAPAVALLAFIAVAVVAYIGGIGTSPLTPELMRRFGKLVASLAFLIVARTLLSQAASVRSLARWLMLAGALQGAIGSGLMLLPPLTQLTLLTRLQIVGYPTGDVLRYVPGPNDTYTDQLRAIGTSVDPNVFGGTLMLALALIVVQWASPRPVLRKSVLLLLAIPTAAGVLLSLSRASWLGLAVGLCMIGALRYRRILVIGLLVAASALVTPVGQDVVARFVSGFSIADRATAFRVGEYANALTLLQRYPLFGIGFGQSPDIDVTAGVSSVYLLVAEQTGLIGLAVYLAALLSVWWSGLRAVRRPAQPELAGLQAALLAAITGAIVAGFLDHYFANQAFPHAVALFWLYAAALVSASRLGPTSERQREPERAAQARTPAFRPYRTPV